MGSISREMETIKLKKVNGNSRTEQYTTTQFTGQVYSRLQKRKGQET